MNEKTKKYLKVAGIVLASILVLMMVLPYASAERLRKQLLLKVINN